jgi:hypothetical protein
MTGQECGCGCGRAVHAAGYASACYRRWLNAGKPRTGPPPPMTAVDRNALAHASRAAQAAAGDWEPDDTDLEWQAQQRAWRESAPERRARSTAGIAVDLVRCVAADDAAGVRLLLHRVRDWPALAVVLAECCDPSRTFAVFRALHGATLAAAPPAAAAAGDAEPGRSRRGTVDRGASDAA